MRVFSLALLWMFAAANAAGAATFHVNPQGTGAFPTIQDAIDACAPGDTVLCAPGTYTGAGNFDLEFGDFDLTLISELGSASTRIEGGFYGLFAFFNENQTRATLLQGFTIVEFASSGCILSVGGSPTFRDLHIADCWHNSDQGPWNYGGGMTVIDGSPLLEDVTFAGNTAIGGNYFGRGGGLGLRGTADVELRHVRFVGNQSNTGGALYCGDSASFDGEDLLFIDNEAWQGGAFHTDTNGVMRIAGASFTGNRAGIFTDYYNHWNLGGAIFAETGRLEIDQAVFRENEAGGGGAIYVETGSLTVDRSTFVMNRANLHGSDLSFEEPDSVRVANCLIAYGRGPVSIQLEIDVAEPPLFICNNVYATSGSAFGGAMEDPTGQDGNIGERPLFCPGEPMPLTLADNSPCLPENNDCGELMGVLGAGCSAQTATGALLPLARLLPPYPNPFNPRTTLQVTLVDPTRLRLSIHDIAGRLLDQLVDGEFDRGTHRFDWDGRDAAGRSLPSGVYLARLDFGGSIQDRKLILLR